MFPSINRPLCVFAALLLSAGASAAQGTRIYTYGFYDRYPYPPVTGGTASYSYDRPWVTVQDQWGRQYDMPLRPKVLYYDAPFATPGGLYRPSRITVMPDSRPPRYSFRIPPTRAEAAVPPPTRTVPPVPPPPETFNYDGGPLDPVPDVPLDPPAGPPPARKVPRVPDAVPDVPRLPEVPPVPAVPGRPEVPKLGPAPRDIPPADRPDR